MNARLETVVLEAADPQGLPWGSAQEEASGERPPSSSGFRVYADPAGHPFCLTWG